MRKKITIALVAIFTPFFFFPILKQEVLAACNIEAPNSTNYSETIGITVKDVPSPKENENPGLSIRDSKGNELFCFSLGWPTGFASITLPSSGDYTTVNVEMRKSAGDLTTNCGEYISGPMCTKKISLIGQIPTATPTLTSGQQNGEYRCNSRNPSCPFNEYPICKEAVVECSPPGCVVGMYLKGGGYVYDCAYKTEVSGQGTCGWDTMGNETSNCGKDYYPFWCEHAGGKDCLCIYKDHSPPVCETISTTTPTDIPLSTPINNILKYSMGIGGIIAFLLIVFGGFQIILSAGNPEKIKAGKEMITSAITGLLLIIFSVFILRLIGVNILGIPGFKP